jgi:tellurite resistance protein
MSVMGWRVQAENEHLMTEHLNAQDALIYTMVLASVAEGTIQDVELETMSRLVKTLPAFADYDSSRINELGSECATLLEQEDGLDIAIERIRSVLPGPLRETAYALACDVIAADGKAVESELRLLEMLRYELAIDRLVAAGIERGAQARHRLI